MRRLPTTAALTLLALTTLSAADHWPQFRGPNAGVVPDDPALPDTWSESQNVVWKVDVPGLGWSSPIVWHCARMSVQLSSGSANAVLNFRGRYELP